MSETTLTIAAESRTLDVSPEDRTFTVGAENRTVTARDSQSWDIVIDPDRDRASPYILTKTPNESRPFSIDYSALIPDGYAVSGYNFYIDDVVYTASTDLIGTYVGESDRTALGALSGGTAGEVYEVRIVAGAEDNTTRDTVLLVHVVSSIPGA